MILIGQNIGDVCHTKASLLVNQLWLYEDLAVHNVLEISWVSSLISLRVTGCHDWYVDEWPPKV